MEKDNSQLEIEAKKAEIISRLQDLLSHEEPELRSWRKGILGSGIYGGGWVRYGDGYNRPSFEEIIKEKRGIGGRLRTKSHYYTVTINAGEDVEGRNEALHTSFYLDIDTGEFRVDQYRGTRFNPQESYLLVDIDKASELDKLSALELIVAEQLERDNKHKS